MHQTKKKYSSFLQHLHNAHNTHLVDQHLQHLLDARLHVGLRSQNAQLGVRRRLVGGIDAGEASDLARARPFVKSFHVSLLAHLQRRVYEDLDERQSGFLVQLPRAVSVTLERRDEAGETHDAAVGEQLRHLRDPADVLLAILSAEAEVPIEARADVVAIERVGGDAMWHKVIL